ncbi:hypothetical protein M8J76_000554 [Diaphorina citri]|nr:hypothetical protein M8J76_000554 [Diaphorina citri]
MGSVKACASAIFNQTKTRPLNLGSISFHTLTGPLLKDGTGKNGNGLSDRLGALFDQCTRPFSPSQPCRAPDCTEPPTPQKECDTRKPPAKVEPKKPERLFYDKCYEEEAKCPKKPCEAKSPPVAAVVAKTKVVPCLPPCRPPARMTEKLLRWLLPVAGFLLGYYLRPPPSPLEVKPRRMVIDVKPPVRECKDGVCCEEGKVEIYSKYCQDCEVTNAVKIYRD